MIRSCFRLAVGALGLWLGGCTVGGHDEALSPAAIGMPGEYRHQPEQPVDPVDLARWWRAFDDPALSELIDLALSANNSIATAEARLRAARASLRAERGTLWPSLSARVSQVEPFDVKTDTDRESFYQAGVDATWEADLFGGRRRSIEAAEADAAAVAADLANAQRSITAEVAFNYMDARGLQFRIEVARNNLANQDDTLQIARWREQAGLVSGLDVEQAITLRAQTAALIPALEQSLDAALNRLAVLVGEAPGAVHTLLTQPAPIPDVPPLIAPGLPAELLQQRPDITAAERALAAEVARIGVAQAQLYPALRLTGTLSGNGNSLSDLEDSLIGQVIGSVTAPIFQGGQLRARVDQQRAGADAAFARYRGTLLLALEETENALFALDRTAVRLAELETAESAARRSVELAQFQYTSGLSDFQDLLGAQRSLLAVSDGRVAARVSHASSAIALFKALGGGWSAESSESRQ